MKIEFFENKFGCSFQLTPETVDEVAMLARTAKSSKSEKPEISFYFSGTPSCHIWIKKINEKSQDHSIRNSK